MKWRLVIVVVALLAAMWFLPTEWWWAKMVLVSAGAGIFLEPLGGVIEEIKLKLTGERDLLAGIIMPVLFCLLAFAGGIVCAKLNGLGWWSILVGVLNAVVFAAVVAISIKATEERKKAANSRTTKPPLKAISR